MAFSATVLACSSLLFSSVSHSIRVCCSLRVAFTCCNSSNWCTLVKSIGWTTNLLGFEHTSSTTACFFFPLEVRRPSFVVRSMSRWPLQGCLNNGNCASTIGLFTISCTPFGAPLAINSSTVASCIVGAWCSWSCSTSLPSPFSSMGPIVVAACAIRKSNCSNAKPRLRPLCTSSCKYLVGSLEPSGSFSIFTSFDFAPLRPFNFSTM
mmetsp:Transcript_75125/g.132768  ORF Transcript_75125/g.132768 Transcript_75125/m.132768 type:complete len:208 (-) Transcript_75125:450-1073(-)